MQRRGLQRQNSAQDMYGKLPKPLAALPLYADRRLYPDRRDQMTRDQRALLNRFGLRGVEAHNEPVIQTYYAAERPGTDAYRAVRLARAVASRRFMGSAKGDRRSRAKALALARTAADDIVPRTAAGKVPRGVAAMMAGRRRRRDKIAYNQKLQDINRTAGGARTGPKRRAAQAEFRARPKPRRTGGSRQRLRGLVGIVWDSAQAAARLVKPPSSLEDKLFRVMQGQTTVSLEKLAQMARSYRSEVGAVAKAVSQFSVGAATVCATKMGGWLAGSIAALLVIPSMALSTQASIKIEKDWDKIVDAAVQKLPAFKVSLPQVFRFGSRAAPAATALGRFVEAAAGLRVPECVLPLFVSAALRGFVNAEVRARLKVDLDYVAMTAALAKHGGKVTKFLQGDKVNLRPLILDLVDAVPPAQVDVALQAINSQYMGLVGRKP